MSAAVRSSFPGVTNAARRPLRRIVRVPLHERHDRDAGFKSGQTQSELGKEQKGDEQHGHRVAMLCEQGVGPSRQVLGVPEHLPDADSDDDNVQGQVHRDDDHGDADGFAKTLQEDRAEPGQQHDGDGDRVIERGRHERVVNDVFGRVRCRQGNGDDEVGRRKPEQHEHERLAAPPWQQVFEHRDAALSVRARGRDPVVNGKRAHESENDENQRCDRRERARCDERDAWLIAQRREVIDAGQAHDFPPRCLMNGGCMRPFGQLTHALEEPVAKRFVQQEDCTILPLQVKRHACDDGIGLEQQRSFNEQSALIVEQVMPPPGGNEFWQHHSDIVVWPFMFNLFDVFQQRLHQRSKWRSEHNQRNAAAPLVPVSPDLFRRSRVDIDIQSPDVGRQCARVVERLNDRSLNSANWYENRVVVTDLPARNPSASTAKRRRCSALC